MDGIDRLLEAALADAEQPTEQLTVLAHVLADRVRFPFPARIAGVAVEVLAVVPDDDGHRISAVASRDGELHRVGLSDLVPGPMPLADAQLIATYRRWLGLPDPEAPPTPRTAGGPVGWRYQRLASQSLDLAEPLDLVPMGTWDPANQYWGEADEPSDPLIEAIVEAGPRHAYEMEQVIPGADPDDWDDDPVILAAELRRAGELREASKILRGLVDADQRCIDAWVHLGNMAFDSKGPKAAFEFYDRAVAIAEDSLGDDFDGVLPRGLVDNRPFHRGLHGLGLCAWRQRRWELAEAAFFNLAWISGLETWDALWCYNAVRAKERWRSD